MQVEQLVHDLIGFHENSNKAVHDWYCLQPLVVVHGQEGKSENCWIVIDGQQRLTTLFLILKALAVKPLYPIEYETREQSGKFLNDIDVINIEKSEDNSRIHNNPDFFCMYTAWTTIKKLLEVYTDRKGLADTILSYSKFIWYESSENPYDEFSKLNSGKISLSNAELIKALLLKETLRSGKKELSQLEAAREWDYMEQTLHDDDFWCFINPSPNDKRFHATRMDFIFEMLLRMQENSNRYISRFIETRRQQQVGTMQQNASRSEWNLLDELEQNPTFIFGVFQDYCEKPENAIAVWNDVQGVFRRMHLWYSDRDLYHRIGYLMNRKGVHSEEKFKQLAHLLVSATQKTKTELKKEIDDEIAVSKILAKLDSLEYGEDNDCIYDVLLLFNIAIMMRQRQEKSRYPFREHRYAFWTLEHIHAKQERAIELKDIQQIAKFLGLGQTGDKQKLVEEINKKFEEAGKKDWEGKSSPRIETQGNQCKLVDNKETHGLGNLALLGHRANATFNNSLYLEKRGILSMWLQGDRKGLENSDSGFDKVEFVPSATIMAFFKQFSQEITYPFLWTEKDAGNYVVAIQETLENVFALKNKGTS